MPTYFSIIACFTIGLLGMRSSIGDNNLPASEVFAIQNANLIPMTADTILPDHTLVIRDRLIEEICPSDQGCTPADALIIDGSGKYLIPGLADMHNHIGGVSFDGRKETYIRTRNQQLRQYVVFGITTMRDPSGNEFTLQVRNATNKGELTGPRIFTSSRLMDGDPPLFPNPATFASVKSAQAFVRDSAEKGYDFIKVYTTLSAGVFDGVMRTAKEVGLSVAAHVPIPVPLEHALAKGLRSIEHLTGYDVACAHPTKQMKPIAEDIYQGWAWCTPEKVASLARLTAQYEVWNVPTLGLWDETRTDFERRTRANNEQRRWEHPSTEHTFDWLYTLYNPHDRAGITGTRAVRLALVKALSDAGAPLLIGTDVAATGYTVHKEMGLFVEAGLTPYQALTAATTEAARYMNMEGAFGVLAKGARADVVFLEKNPLENIDNTKTVHSLFINGAWWSKQRLANERIALQREYAEDAAVMDTLGIEAVRKNLGLDP